MTASTDQATAAYLDRLDQLSRQTQTRVVAMFDQVAPWSWDDAGRFRDAVTPYLSGAAQAAVDVTGAYASLIQSGTLPVISDLIIADAAARGFVPFDRLAHVLATGGTMAQAVAQGRNVAGTLGHDTIYRTSRRSLAQYLPDMPGWMRRVSPDACDWCMELSQEVFDTAAAATFGHDHDKCIALPAHIVGDHNARIRDQAGWESPEAKAERAKHDQAASLRRQIATAQRRQAEAKAEAATEPDPARRERLETREQEWETRAEAASEQLRILLTGTWRL